MNRSVCTTILVSAFFCAGRDAKGALLVDVDTRLNLPYSVLSNDLLQTDLQSTSSNGNFQNYGASGLPVLHDGQFGRVGNLGNGAELDSAFALSGSQIIYTLSNASGYQLSSVITYAGWDGFRGGQAYTVGYDTTANPGNYLDLATVSYDQTGGEYVNTRVTISDSSGMLATDVHSIRFQFANVTAGDAAYREIDIAGTSVPEIKSSGLVALGLAVFGAFRILKRRLPSQQV